MISPIRIIIRFATIFACVSFLPFLSFAQEMTFFISTEGNDAADGRTPGTAFASISRAQEAIRALKGGNALSRPVVIYLRGGVYELTEPVMFGPEDSGTPDYGITYTSFPGETAVVSGGRRIAGFKQVEGGVWRAEIPAVKSGNWNFRQLFVNGMRRQRSRIPEEGFFYVNGMVSSGNPARLHDPEKHIRKDWINSDVEIVSLHKWTEFRLFIRGRDEESDSVTLSMPFYDWIIEKNGRFWIENAREGFDSPGEWYLDREGGALLYRPLPGESIGETEFVAPALGQLVRFEGMPESEKCVTDIRLLGLTFVNTDWSLPSEGYTDMQAAVQIPGVIFGKGAERISVEDCVIKHHGNYGIEFERGCKFITISGNEISDMGAGGVRIGEPRERERAVDMTLGNQITDNHIFDIGNVYRAACGIILFRTGKNRIAHNHIHDTYYTGISNGWSWGYDVTSTRENIIEYNHVHDIGRGMLSDMGGNYNLGVQPGTIIRNNLFHDISSYGYGGWGIYTDEGSSHILIENNLVYRTKTGGFHQHYGRENIVRNNIFAFSTEGQIIRTRMENHVSFMFNQNIVYWDKGPLLGSNWKDDKYRVDYNLYFQASGEPVTFKSWSFEEWKARGNDVHSLIADPLFVDPQNGNFNLKPGSPALKIGFKPIDISKVGPRK